MLLNELQVLDTTVSQGQRPTNNDVSALFERFEAKRKPRQHEASDASALLTRLHAYDGWWNWFSMRCILPVIGMTHLADQMAEL